MAFCRNCGTKLIADARYCHMCGTSASDNSVTSEQKDNRKIITCPNCNAVLKLSDDLDYIRCQYCGTDIMLDDQASELNRMLKAKSNAKRRDIELDMEYDRHQEKMRRHKFILENPLFSLIAFLLLIYVIMRMAAGQFGGIDIIFDAIILSFVWKKTGKNKND